ncbi:MAG TPA: hypothetical protein VIF60_24340 [Burkholderiaceae bacterium]|jgi:hypothetical protein
MDYKPATPPSDPAQLPGFLAEELRKLQFVLAAPQKVVYLALCNAAPAKLKDGMTVYADGTHWNPGSGRGVYTYENGVWKYLG